MDILRFANSKDLRDYLREVGYQIDSLEAAWLIYQCRDATIKEKHKAWKELIKSMPNCDMPPWIFGGKPMRLHTFLRKHIELEDRLISEFYDEKSQDSFGEPAQHVYKFDYIYKSGQSYDFETVFSRFDAHFESIMEPSEDVVSIRCTKMQVDVLNSWQIAYLTPTFDILRLDACRIEGEEENDVFQGVFDMLCVAFPTPHYLQYRAFDFKRYCDNRDRILEDMMRAGVEQMLCIKIWLDDERDAPEGYYHCKSVNEAKNKILECERDWVVIDEINCNHDLGDYAQDGGDGIKLLDWLVERQTFYPIVNHTADSVGRENMQREIDRYWKR